MKDGPEHRSVNTARSHGAGHLRVIALALGAGIASAGCRAAEIGHASGAPGRRGVSGGPRWFLRRVPSRPRPPPGTRAEPLKSRCRAIVPGEWVALRYQQTRSSPPLHSERAATEDPQPPRIVERVPCRVPTMPMRRTTAAVSFVPAADTPTIGMRSAAESGDGALMPGRSRTRAVEERFVADGQPSEDEDSRIHVIA